MKIKTNMILNEKKKIEINIINRREVIIEEKLNKGIIKYIEWMTENNGKIRVIEENNRTILVFEEKIKVFTPNMFL